MISHGRLIAAARQITGQTQTQLAKASGLTRATINYWESKNRLSRRQTNPLHTNSGPSRIERALYAAGVEFIDNGLRIRRDAGLSTHNAQARARDVGCCLNG